MKRNLKERLKQIPVLGMLARRIRRLFPRSSGDDSSFEGSAAYWENRYRSGATSGDGSYGRLASFKSQILNSFVRDHGVRTVIEFGCGDGNQLQLAEYPSYFGLDVSDTSVDACRQMFRDDPGKTFASMENYQSESAELAMSLDVIYHLVEDHIFDLYMHILFNAATRFVVIYSSNENETDVRFPHVRHRIFSDWIDRNASEWCLLAHIPNKNPYKPSSGRGSKAEFYIYERSHPISTA